MKAYLAGPFFNEKQIKIIEDIKILLKKLDIDFYSPKDDCLYIPGGNITPKECFTSNLIEIDNSNFIIAVTDGLDAGTLFESGYAFRQKTPIIYIWLDHQGRPFNLMLSESASYVAYNYNDLYYSLLCYRNFGAFPKYRVKGEVQ